MVGIMTIKDACSAIIYSNHPTSNVRCITGQTVNTLSLIASDSPVFSFDMHRNKTFPHAYVQILTGLQR
jgi:hypothetical protein